MSGLPIWSILVLTLLGTTASAEVGLRLGTRRRLKAEGLPSDEPTVGAMVGATLGLLGFLLAYTFGLAAEAFHERKLAQLHEANAVGSVFFQSRALPEPLGSEVRQTLVTYLDLRLKWADAPVGRVPSHGDDLVHGIRVDAIRNAITRPDDVSALFIESVDNLGHAQEEHNLLREHSRIPLAYWLVLATISALSFAAVGYHHGVAGTRRTPVTTFVAVTFSLVITLIADIDRPGEGWVNVHPDAMRETKVLLERSL